MVERIWRETESTAGFQMMLIEGLPEAMSMELYSRKTSANMKRHLLLDEHGRGCHERKRANSADK
jgi:hypothetical protein